jgi:hypothetical protein
MSVEGLYLWGFGGWGELNIFCQACFQRGECPFLRGTSSVVHFDTNLTSAIGRSRVLVVEGSLWEIPQTIEAILQACDARHQQGVLVALTVSDVSCVKQHHQQFWQWTFCQSESILLARFAQLNVVIYDWTGVCQSQIGFWIHVHTT